MSGMSLVSDDDNAGAIQARAKQRWTLNIERGRRLKGESALELMSSARYLL